MADLIHLDILLNNFAIRSFRDTADKDYITARMAYRAQLMQPFQWSAIHCLEKYAKCILVLNRLDSKDFKHSVSGAIERMNDSGKFAVELSSETLNYIHTLEKYGAEHRYYEVPYVIEPFALMELDLAVWEIRRYCQVLDFELKVEGSSVKMLEPKLRQIRKAKQNHIKNTEICGGVLEGIMRKKGHPAREPLIWKNLRFGNSSRKKISVRTGSEWGNSPLSLHPEIIDEVVKYAFVPKKIAQSFRDLKNANESEIRRQNRKLAKDAKIAGGNE